MSIEAKFNAAVSVIRNLPKNGSYQPSNELMLRFYSYFKQATEGPVKGPRPGFWDVVKRAKWDAWARLGNMPQEEAMQRYVDELNKIVETMAFTDNVADFLTSLDSFSRQVPMEDLEMCIGPTLEKVRSQPGSPLSGTPFGSRDASPTRNSVASIEPVNDLDEEDEDFLDSMEVFEPSTFLSWDSLEHILLRPNTLYEMASVKQAEPESRVKPESVKKIHHVNGSSGFTKDVRMVNGYLEPRKNMDTAVTEGLQKAVESLRRDLTQTNYKLMTLEHHLENINKRAQLFGCLSKEAVIFIAVWPIVVHFLLRRIMRRSE